MKLRKMIKQKARAALSGNRGRAVLLMVIYLMVSLVINLADAAALRLLGYEFTLETVDVYTYSNDFFYNLPALLVTLITWIVRLVLVLPLGYGIVNWCLELTDRRKQSAMHIFWPYESKAALRGILLSINIAIKMILLSCLVLTLPVAVFFAGDMAGIGGTLSMTLAYSGIVLATVALILLWAFAQRFALAPMLLCEKYQFTVHQAVKTSIRFTKGHRFELLRLELSFLPWLLPLIASSGMMSFSIMYDEYSAMPLVWLFVFLVVAIVTYLLLTPYYTMSRVMYARYLYEYGQWQKNGIQPTATQENSSEVAPTLHSEQSEATAGNHLEDADGAEQTYATPYSPQELPVQPETSVDDVQPPSDYL